MTYMKRILAVFLLFTFLPVVTFPHCEIPCGIYNDRLRIDSIKEHITTIEKSMKQIEMLSKETPVNYNQLIRWVTNKEHHAAEIQDIVQQYFMTQRIKPADKGDKKAYDKYIAELTLLHNMLVYSMKTKQTTDLDHIETLRMLVGKFDKSYFQGKEKEHKH